MVNLSKEEIIKLLKSSLKVSLIVGTVLSLVNQPSLIFNFSADTTQLIKIFFNYLIPLLVSAYSRFSLLNEISKKEINYKNE